MFVVDISKTKLREMLPKWGLRRRRSQLAQWVALKPLRSPLLTLPCPDASWAVDADYEKPKNKSTQADTMEVQADDAQPYEGMALSAEEEEPGAPGDMYLSADDEEPDAPDDVCLVEEDEQARPAGDQRPLSAAGQQAAQILEAMRRARKRHVR